MTRTHFCGMLLVSVASAFIGAIVGSRATVVAPAYGQLPPAAANDRPYSSGGYRPYSQGAERSRPLAPPDQRRPASPVSIVPQLALPGGSVAAQSFQFVDQAGQVQCTLALGPETTRGPTLVLLDRNGEQVYTLPPQLAVHPVVRGASAPN
jgi:hypothetical protein